MLIHRRTLPIFQMATPTKQVVERLEGIRDRMLNPPKVTRYMKIVAYVSPDDSLADVMRIVFESDFSQFPVMNGKEVTGLLTENGITRWLARKIVCEDSLVESADAKVSDIVMSEEKRKNFIKLHLNLILNKFDDYYYLLGSRNRISIKILNFYFNALILIYHQIIVTRIIKSNANNKLLFY